MKYLINGQETFPFQIGEACEGDSLSFLFQDEVCDYLHNEVRIISLARKKQEAFMKKYSLSQMEEYLWKGLDELTLLKDILKMLSNRMRKLLRDFAKENNFRPLEDLIGSEWWQVKIFLLEEENGIYPGKKSVLRGRHRTGLNGKYAFGVEILKEGGEKPIRYAASDECIKCEGYWRGGYDIRYADLGWVFSVIFLFKSTLMWLKNEGISKKEEYQYPENLYVQKETCELKFFEDLFMLVQESYGTVPVYTKEETDAMEKHGETLTKLYAWELKEIFKKNPADYLKEGYNPFYILFHSSHDGRFENLVFREELGNAALYLTARRASEVKKAEQIRKYASTSRAKSYQTKKNIPLKIQKMMETSEFNHYFDYVEFDEECDISRLREVGKEVLAFFEEMPKIKSFTKGNSIRFRKLGNHKALGLYYPEIQCLCVELRNTTSFIHELGHLIDYCMEDGGQLSEQPAFFRLLSLYREYLEDHKKEIGKGKYNLSYFKDASDVFARSFELYIVKVKKYKNNLIPDSFSAKYYPADREDILSEIKQYFDSLKLLEE